MANSPTTGPNQSDQDHPSRQRRVRWLVIAAGSLLALAGIALALLAHFWPFSSDLVAQSLQNTFSGTLSGSVTFTHFHSTYFPHPGCVAEGVVFVRRSSAPGAPPLAIIQRLTIQAEYADLLLRPGYVAHVGLEGFHIQVPPRGSGIDDGNAAQEQPSRSNARVGEVVADGALLEIAREGGNPLLKFDIHSLTLRSLTSDGSLSYRVAFLNPLPPGEIRSSGHFGPWHHGDAGQTPVSGTYVFDHADLSVVDGIAGALSSEGNFQGTLENIESRGTIDIPDFQVSRSGHAVHLHSRFHGFVNGTNGDVALERVDTSLLRTTVTASGRIAALPGQDGKTTTIDFTVSQGRIQDLLRLFVREAGSPLNGIADFQAHVTVPPQWRPFVQEVQLQGDFGVANGHFTKPETQDKVDSLSERAGGKKPDERPDDDPENVVSGLRGHVSLKDGTATLTDLSFSVPSALAQMHGTYNLVNEHIDFHGTLATDAKFSQTTSGVKSVLLKPFNAVFKGKPRGAIIPVQMNGTYSDAHAGLDLVPKKNQATPPPASTSSNQ